jgi:hypothetical protein
MNRAEFPAILANLRRAGNPAAADAKARELDGADELKDAATAATEPLVAGLEVSGPSGGGTARWQPAGLAVKSTCGWYGWSWL